VIVRANPGLALLLGGFLSGCAGGMTSPVKSGEWPAYARDPGGMRHSPLAQINRDNVAQLEVAWTYRTGELATYAGTTLASKAAFEATPLMVDGVRSAVHSMSSFPRADTASSARPWVTTSRRFHCPDGGSNPAVDLTICHDAVAWSGHRFKVNPFFNQTATLVLLPRSRVCCH
jgi:hypothetical protein